MPSSGELVNGGERRTGGSARRQLLAFVLGGVALIGMQVSVRLTGADGAPLAPLVVMLVLSAAALAGMLRRLSRAGASS